MIKYEVLISTDDLFRFESPIRLYTDDLCKKLSELAKKPIVEEDIIQVDFE